MKIDCPNCGRITVSSFTLSASPNYRPGKCPSCGAAVAAQTTPAKPPRIHLSFFSSIFADVIKAAEANDLKEVRRCLKESWFAPDVNSVDDCGYSALHYAMVKGNVEMVKFLLLVGANPNQVADNGISPLDFAYEKERRKREPELWSSLASILEAKGAVRSRYDI